MQPKRVTGFPLSSQQSALQLLQQRYANLPNISECRVRIIGHVEVSALARAVDLVVARHEILRTTFVMPPEEEGLLQVVHDPPIGLLELSADGTELHSTDHEVEAGLTGLRAILVSHGPDDCTLRLMAPLLSLDVTSYRLLLDEIAGLYLNGETSINDALEPLQYVDYAIGERELFETETGSIGRSFWRSSLAEHTGDLEQAASGSDSCKRVSICENVSSQVLEKIYRIALDSNAPVFVPFLASWIILQSHSLQVPKPLVTYLHSGRSSVELEKALGMFEKHLPLQPEMQWACRFDDWVKALNTLLNENDKWHLSYAADWRTSKAFLAPSFQWEAEAWTRNIGVTRLVEEKIQAVPSVAPMNLLCRRVVDGVDLMLTINADSGTEQEARMIAARFKHILMQVAESSSLLLGNISVLPEKERRQVIEEFNNAPAALSQQLCIHHLFERQVNLSPDSIALVFEDHQLSYEGLNMAANRLARHLIALGVSAEVCVALCLQRGIEMVIALLAVLKAGGTYVPMGKDEPTHRLGQMLDGCGAVVLLTQQELTASLPVSWAMVVSIDADQGLWSQESGQDLGVELDDRCLAYQIYTSGSSGQPKAVGVEHRQVVNYVAGVSERMGLESRWRMCLMTTIAADLGYTMLYPSLCLGGELHVVSEEVGTDSRKWERYSSERRIEVVKLTPTHMQGLMRGKQAIPQRVMVVGGEVCRREWVERVKQEGERCEVYNHYGPTECTVGVVMRRVEGEEEGERIAIGRPLRGSRAYVMDWRGEVAGVSMRGELGIGGGGLSRGYMRDAEKTAERFVPDGVSGRAGRAALPYRRQCEVGSRGGVALRREERPAGKSARVQDRARGDRKCDERVRRSGGVRGEGVGGRERKQEASGICGEAR